MKELEKKKRDLIPASCEIPSAEVVTRRNLC